MAKTVSESIDEFFQAAARLKLDPSIQVISLVPPGWTRTPGRWMVYVENVSDLDTYIDKANPDPLDVEVTVTRGDGDPATTTVAAALLGFALRYAAYDQS